MLNGSDGWGVDQDAILRTTDGGSTWENITPSNAPANIVLQDGFFLNTTSAWVAYGFSGGSGGGGVLSTSNGGTTWTVSTVASGSDFNVLGPSLYFTDPLHGWLLVGLGAATSNEEASVYSTTNGGSTWTSVSGTGPLGGSTPPPPGSLPGNGTKSGISFASITNGWVTGYSPAQGYVMLYRTTDGGTTWAQQVLPNPTGYNLSQIYVSAVSPPKFFSSNDGVLTLSGGALTCIYSTANGGARWDLVKVFPVGGAMVSFASATAGWVLTGGTLEGTHNGGSTWSALSLPAGFAGGDIQLVTRQIGLAWNGAGGSVWKTTDGGTTWQLLAMSLATRQ